MTNHWVTKPLLLTAILSLLFTQCAAPWRFVNANDLTQNAQGGFVGVYRNFPSNVTDFPPVSIGQSPGLIYSDLPWRPKTFGAASPLFGKIQRTDWYEIPSCLVTIDPAVTGVTIDGHTGIGLSFYMTSAILGTGNWTEELNGGLPDDPYYFTAHWEARINVTRINCTVVMESDDDSWLFVDNNLLTALDLGGTHGIMSSPFYPLSPGLHTIDIFYAERCDFVADFKVVFSPASAVTILDPSEICTKKSFEDLLRHQAESIQSFEDLLRLLPPANRTSELFESLENLTEEQEGLLKSFEGMINQSSLLPAEFISLLDSFEDLLHRQYGIKEGFMDMLNESKPYLPDFPTFLSSTENLLRSDDELLQSFEELVRSLFSLGSVVVDQKTYFLESYEHLLENQSQLLEKFEKLIDDPSATQAQIDAAVASGTAWLAAKQNANGSWGTSCPIAETGFAVLKFETHAIDSGIDPLSTGYQYYSEVRSGLDYLFSKANKISIGVQLAGNPDISGDHTGVYWREPGQSPYATYDTGTVMMAIAASTHPEMTVKVAGNVVGWTYKQVEQDTVDYMAWGQTDTGYGRGGWDYGATNNSSALSDQSNTGFVTMGLTYAEAPFLGFSCTIPAFVRTELNIWIGYIQNKVSGSPDEGGSGYYSPTSWVNILKTGHLLLEMAFIGDSGTSRVQDAVAYLVRHWSDPNDGSSSTDSGWRGFPASPASYLAMYATMKGLETLQISTIDGIDWFGNFADTLVAQQNIDGSWPPCCFDMGDSILATEWALLTLEKAVPPHPSFKESFEDLLRRQADRIVSFENLLGNLPAMNRTSELFESLENLTGEQEGLLKSFGGMINASSLLPAEFISLLDSFEDLLHRQYGIKEGFMDMLNESKPYLQPNFSEFLSSVEDLLRSDAQLLETFEDQVRSLFSLGTVTIEQKIHFLESYEQLLEDQSRLMSKFKELSEDASADVAVTNVDVSPTTVLSGDVVNINVSVQDTGDFAETFNVTVYANSQAIGEQSVSLDSGSSTNIAFAWDTTGFGKGDYLVSASASVVPDEVNTADNTRFADNIVTILYLCHDVAVTDVATSKTVVGQGYSLNMTVTAANQGDYTETFNVTVYANTIVIASQSVTLTSGNSTILPFTWTTIGFAYGNYTISAYAWPVPGETDTADNNFTCNVSVHVGVPGDVSSSTPGVYDLRVDMRDIAYVVSLFNIKPSSPSWNPNADVDNNGVVDMKDIAIAIAYFNQHE